MSLKTEETEVSSVFLRRGAYTLGRGGGNVIGRLEFVPGGRGRGELVSLYGLPVLQTRADPEGRFGEHRVRRAGRVMKRGGVRRTILPAGFNQWELLERFGLRHIDPAPLLRANAPELAVEALRGRDADPARATVALSGGRADGEMFRCAAALCLRVRRLVVDAEGGEDLAFRLREMFGIPVLPREHPAQLELCLHPGGRVRGEPRLEMFGQEPELEGLKLTAPGLDERDREALDVLALLWERGKLSLGEIKIHRN